MQNCRKGILNNITIKTDIAWVRFHLTLLPGWAAHKTSFEIHYRNRMYIVTLPFLIFFLQKEVFQQALELCIPFSPLIYILYHRWNAVVTPLFDKPIFSWTLRASHQPLISQFGPLFNVSHLLLCLLSTCEKLLVKTLVLYGHGWVEFFVLFCLQPSIQSSSCKKIPSIEVSPLTLFIILGPGTAFPLKEILYLTSVTSWKHP